MAYLRNKGWPRTLRGLVLIGLDRGLDIGFRNPFTPFEVFIAIREEPKKTLVSLGGRLSLVFTFTGPDKDKEYKLRIRDGKRKEIVSLFVNLCNDSSRQAAENAVADVVGSQIRSLSECEGDVSVWKEFDQRDLDLSPLEP